jgi:hypothetical protein
MVFNLFFFLNQSFFFFPYFKFIKTLVVQIIQVADYQKINSMKSTFKKKKKRDKITPKQNNKKEMKPKSL